MIGGRLNGVYIEDFIKSFHANCLSLISEAHLYLVANKTITVDFDEERISAHIFVYIDDSPEKAGFDIHISDECRQYCEDVLSGKKKAKSAPRIDLRFSKNWMIQKETHKFWVEAKILTENDCKKNGRKTPIRADYYHRRYITTGIDKFVDGTYPQPGCVLGYVLEGCPMQIFDRINALLCADKRNAEQLSHIYSGVDNLSHYFHSSHSDNLVLGHYWLGFS
jgi:hypothetical protein